MERHWVDKLVKFHRNTVIIMPQLYVIHVPGFTSQIVKQLHVNASKQPYFASVAFLPWFNAFMYLNLQSQ